MKRTASLTALLLVALAGADLAAQEAAPVDDRFATPDGLITALYDMVSFEAGTMPDWNEVRSTFLPEAIVVLFTSRTNARVMSLDGFILDWYNFIYGTNVRETGFTETILKMDTLIFKDIAQVLVLYESAVPGSPRPPQQGVDFFSLVKRDGRWFIASVTNDLPDPNNPPPEVLQD